MLKSVLKLVVLVSLLFAIIRVNAQDVCKPVGWATQSGGVTGGGSATPTVVSTYADLKSAISSSSVKVIHIKGTITFPSNGRINIQDQNGKSILGLPGAKLVSVDLTASGSGIFYLKRCSNLIMRNIIFEGPGAYDADGNDNLTVDGCTNVWIDHCEFHDSMDGNLDLKNAADLISITWCTFSYEKKPIAGGPGNSDDHRYSNLIGSSDGATGDAGKLRITFQYCWWGEGCRERMPRVRYGKIHLVNNLFSSSVSNHCIRAAYKADILAEGNYFDKQKLPIDLYDGDYTGVKGTNNFGAADVTKGSPFTAPYLIAVATPASIVSPIKSCAGAKLTDPAGCSSCGSGANVFPSVSIKSPSNNQQFSNAPTTVSITADAADADGSIAKVEFYNGNTLLGSDNSSPYSFSWTNVAAGSYSITAKATDNKGAVTTSSVVSILVSAIVNVAPTVSITSPTNGQTYASALATVSLTANAADNDGSISKVEYYNGTTFIGAGTGSNFAFSWTNVAADTYSITAKATDNKGAVKTSDAISITVNVGSTSNAAVLSKHGSGSSTQTIDVATPIVSFNYDWTNATTVTVTGMPAGIVVDINTTTKIVTFTGSPTQTGTFPFTITTVGGNPNATKSGTINVSGTLPNILPVVSILTPTDNQSFTATAAISFSASASDEDGTISKVEYYNGNNLLGTATSESFTFTWTNVAIGNYSITAKAIDNDGGISTDVVTFVVVAPVVKDCYGVVNGKAVLDNCGACVGGTTGFVACSASIEAETVCYVDGVSSEATNAGFSGTGYVNTTNALGSIANWNFKAATNGKVTLSFRYANGGATNRNANVSMNGTKVAELILAPTGSWAEWAVASISVDVVAGTNKLLLAANSEDGLANLDIISFSAGLASEDCIVTSLSKNEMTELSVYPNPTQDLVRLSKTSDWELYNAIGLKIKQGNGNKIDLTTSEAGVYFIKIETTTFKIIKN